MSRLKLACAQYPIGRFAALAEWQAHAARWVAEAAEDGAALLLFPEYGAMELASLLSPALQRDLRGQIAALQEFLPHFVETYRALARRHRCHIVAPSFPVAAGEGFRNRAYVLGPDGGVAFQEKRQMTRFEREEWIIQGGAALKVFQAAWGRFAVAVCYDIEFPLIARAQAEAGADLILAPSCTDTLAGHHRVHVGARARALESQVYVAVAPTVGEAKWSPAVDVNVGAAAVYAAPDRGLPDDGVLALGVLNAPGWVMADLDFGALKAARQAAQVFTRADWPDQGKPGLGIEMVAV